MLARSPFARIAAAFAVSATLLSAACKDTAGPGNNGGNDGGNDGGNNGGATDTTTPAVTVSIQTDQDRAAISPYIYGSNQDRAGNTWTIRRYGGNRLTGYNWENNYSNAGNDWYHSSDTFLLSDAGLSNAQGATPGIAMTHFHDQSLAMGAASIITLQMAGYASADGNGNVSQAETAPSPRWVKVEPKKPSPFSATPSLTDGAVYMDELVNLLVTKYGTSTSARGVRWYSLDNEPCLWSSTHPRIHPQSTNARELVDRSVALASAVKAVDPQAGILGPALYGMSAYLSCQDAPDWAGVKGTYGWFIDYYLDQMRLAGTTAGKRLLDALDVHWYPEARGDNRITDGNATTPNDEDARMQAPRSLYDGTYVENSWIGQWQRGFLPLLPTLQASIARYYPGTKLAITEYYYGGGSNVSGGLAQVDVLGAFGRNGVEIATMWGIQTTDTYIGSAFNLYRNYDGKGGTYGSTAVRATTSDLQKAAGYAALDPQGALHVMFVNRTRAAMPVRFNIQGGTFTAASAWGFDATGASIRELPGVSKITSNTFTYSVPALAAVHLVLH